MLTIVYSIILFDIDGKDAIELRDYGLWIEVPALMLTIIYLLDLIANAVVLRPIRIW